MEKYYIDIEFKVVDGWTNNPINFIELTFKDLNNVPEKLKLTSKPVNEIPPGFVPPSETNTYFSWKSSWVVENKDITFKNSLNS